MASNSDVAERVEEIKRETRHAVRTALDDYPNTTGHGFGFVESDGKRTGEIGIVVGVEQRVDEADLDPEDVLPREIEGYRVDVQIDEQNPEQTGDRDLEQSSAVGGLQITAPNVTWCTLGGPRFIDPDGTVVGLTNAHCVDDATNADVWHPESDKPNEDPIGQSKDVGGPGDDYATVEYEEGVDSFASNLAIGAMGPKEQPVLGEIYLNNGVTHGYWGSTCTRVGEDGNDDWYDRPSEIDWGGHSGSLWGRLDDDGVFYPTSLHWGNSGDETSLAVSWEGLEDHLGGSLDVDVSAGAGAGNQPDDSWDGRVPNHEVAVYDAEIDGRFCHLKLVTCNTGGNLNLSPETTTIRVQSADGDEPDDDEHILDIEVEESHLDYSLREVTIPRVNAYRRVVIESEDHDSDILVDDSPPEYFGFTYAEFDAPEYHPEGTVGVDYLVKNPSPFADGADVELLVDEAVVDTHATGDISNGEFVEDTLEWPVTDADLGTHDVEVQTPDETIDLGQVEVQPLTITAEVHDDGTPVQGADVYIVDTTDEENFEVVDVYQTDVNGEIDEDFDAGQYHALVDEDGHNALSRGFIDVSTHVEFALEDYTAPDADNVDFDLELIPEDVEAAIEAHDTDAATVAGVREREAEITAADVDSASVAGVRTRDASIASIDVDAATIEGDRTREAEVSAVDVDSAAVAGVTEGRIEGALNAHDTDSASVAGDRARDAEITAHDVDAASVSGAQVGIINGALSASDVDSASVAGTRAREATISAIDVDAAVVSGVVAGLISGNVEVHDTDSAAVAGTRTREAAIASIDVDAAAVAGVTTNLITAELSAHDTDAASVAGVRTREAAISAIDVDTASVAGMQTGIIHGAITAHDTDSASVAGVRTREGAIASHDTDAAAIESAFIPHLDRLHPAALRWREDNPDTLRLDQLESDTLHMDQDNPDTLEAE